MKGLMTILLAITFFSLEVVAQQEKQPDHKQSTFAVGKIEKLAGNFMFTEGPAVNSEGDVYFTDVRNHMILVWYINETLDTFRTKSGRANGLYFDKTGTLYICEGEKGQITSINPDGIYSVVASQYEGIRFNQPNDLWIDGKGGIYFTDPKYGANDSDIPQDGMHVYYIKPNGKGVIRVCDDLEKPNGVIGTPDGKTLYVTDAGAGRTYQYSIHKDGTLKNKALFVEVGCDGMTIDNQGNLYLTPGGEHKVDIYAPSGELLESIEVPERPTNVTFGGEHNKQLYITARTSIYRIELTTSGAE